ncbi:MAG: hypothetical protein BWK79_09370 [Beggiatoa sp. IS2]|nr:MAG: hypothetical protein BWK79_09370 [Beggiatoa sp. IS2]
MDKLSLHLQYVTDEAGNKTAVILPLQEFETLVKLSAVQITSPVLSKPLQQPESIGINTVVTSNIDTLDITTQRTRVFSLEQKIIFLTQYYEVVNRMLTGLRYYENATAKLDRKLQIQRVITDLESELQDQSEQLKLLKINADTQLVQKIRESNKTALFDSTEYSLEQELMLLEQQQQLFTKVWEELRQQEPTATGGERQPQTKKLISTLENELQNTRWRLGQLKKNVVFAALYNVPELPKHWLTDEKLFTQVKAQLFVEAVGYQKAPLLIYGVSGAGKSVLVTALAQDNEVRKAFPDGIFWLTLGKEANLLAFQTTLIQTLESSSLCFYSVEATAEKLQQLCATRSTLIILDDVWDAQDILPFNVMGEHNQVIVTTSDNNLLGILKFFIPEAQGFEINAFTVEQAKSLFTKWVNEKKLQTLPVKVEELIRACDYHPATLKLVANMVNSQPPASITELLKELKNEDYELPQGHPASLMHALRLNVEALGDQGEYYLALAVFQSHLHIPEPTVLMLWRYLYQLLDEQTYNFINSSAKKGLLTVRGKIPHRVISLQLFQYDYLVAEADVDKLHTHVLAAYRRQCAQHGWISGPDDGYFFEYLGYHLIQAGRRNELRQLLVDYDWLHRKLLATSIHSLTNDFEWLEDKSLEALKQALYESVIVLASDKQELANQLLDRLWETQAAKNNKDIQAVLNQAKETSPNWSWQPHFSEK